MTKNETKPQDAAKVLAELRERQSEGGRKAWRNTRTKAERSERGKNAAEAKYAQKHSMKPTAAKLMPKMNDRQVAALIGVHKETIRKWRIEAGIAPYRPPYKYFTKHACGKIQVRIKGKYIGLFTTQKEADAKVAELTNKTK